MGELTGTAGADQLLGTSADEALSGLDGDDTIAGGAGSDTLNGGTGDDRLNDNDGNDVLLGGAGMDGLQVDHSVFSSVVVPAQSVSLDGGDGADYLTASTNATHPLYATMIGGAGDDSIFTGGDITATIDAGDGNDQVQLSNRRFAPATVTLGLGADTLNFTPSSGWTTFVTVTDFRPGDAGDRLAASLDFFLGGWDRNTNPFAANYLRLVQQGADTVLQVDSDGSGTQSTFVDLIRLQNVQASSLTAFNTFGWLPSGQPQPPVNLVGTPEYDALTGASSGDLIQGLGSGDWLSGLGGSDTLDGGDGDDQILGGAGGDSLLGGDGNDYIAGHGSGFALEGGVDTIRGGGGDDQIDGGPEGNLIFGEEGNDRIKGSNGPDTLNGGAGADSLTDGSGNDALDCGDGADYLFIVSGNDTIASGGEADRIFVTAVGHASPIQVTTITDWSPEDQITFTDNLGYPLAGPYAEYAAASFDAALSQATALRSSGLTFVAIQVGNDVYLFMGQYPTDLQAARLVGRSLADVSEASVEHSWAAPTTGGSTAQPTSGNDNLTAGPNATEIHAGAGNDTITGASTADYLRGDDGDDRIIGGPAFDDANGNAGNDTVSTGAGDDWAVGGKDNDSLSGESGSDVVWGNLGNDTQDGGDGNDQVRGGQGDDSVSGGAGDDFVSGDRGNDTIAGGAGADLFHGSQDAGIDRVLDFHRTEGDRVMLDPGTTYSVSQVGADTVIDMGGGHQMILVGVTMSSLTGDWLS